MKQLLPVFLFLIAGLGCSKEDLHPVINLDSPEMGHVFTNGQSIRIKGSVTDDKQINEIFIKLSNADTDAIIVEFYLDPKSQAAVFDYPVTASSGIHYRLQVIAKDNVRNDTRTLVEFTCI